VARNIWLVGRMVAWTAMAGRILCGPIDAVSGGPADTRIRAISAEAAKLLAEGQCRSATIRALVARLESSDVIVFVQLSLDPAIGQGQTSLVGASSGTRYLQSQVSARLSPSRRIEILGHELWHATEIADMHNATDQQSLREAYLKAGWQLGTGHAHETDAARNAERQVMREIAVEPRNPKCFTESLSPPPLPRSCPSRR
jgi:hypothetical protein